MPHKPKRRKSTPLPKRGGRAKTNREKEQERKRKEEAARKRRRKGSRTYGR